MEREIKPKPTTPRDPINPYNKQICIFSICICIDWKRDGLCEQRRYKQHGYNGAAKGSLQQMYLCGLAVAASSKRPTRRRACARL